ncbi:MAG: hypothetical protein K2W96_17630 [Gemmataceae bacterium]|nr:hypothetical protein [Gemmataceae bacterium]
MTPTIEAAEQVPATLETEAAGLGMTVQEYIVHLLTDKPGTETIRNGADLVSYWEKHGVIGSRPDILDSQAEARRLREQAQRREG